MTYNESWTFTRLSPTIWDIQRRYDWTSAEDQANQRSPVVTRWFYSVPGGTAGTVAALTSLAQTMLGTKTTATPIPSP